MSQQWTRERVEGVVGSRERQEWVRTVVAAVLLGSGGGGGR